MAISEASVASYDARLKLQQSMIDQAAATLASAEADLEREQQDYKRYSELMTSDLASRQRFEQAQADARKGEAAVARSGASLAGEQNQLAVLRSQQREEQARLQQARANLQLAQNDLDNTVIRSPVSGIAGNRAGRSVSTSKPGSNYCRWCRCRMSMLGEFQGNPADAHAAGTARRGVGRSCPDMTLEGRIESFAPGSGAQFSLLPPRAGLRPTTRPATSPRSFSACRRRLRCRPMVC